MPEGVDKIVFGRFHVLRLRLSTNSVPRLHHGLPLDTAKFVLSEFIEPNPAPGGGTAGDCVDWGDLNPSESPQ